MRKITLLVLSFCSFLTLAQTTTDLGVWLEHLPYSRAVDMALVGEDAYVATAQGVFIYNRDEESFTRISKVNGLSDVDLSSISHNADYGVVAIGYANGNIDLLYGIDQIVNVPAIRQTRNYTGLKTINHIHPDGELLYFATDFGIVTYDLESEIVDETFIIGAGGTPMQVYETATLGDSIYAATPEGLMAANLSSQLSYFENWNLVAGTRKPVNTITVFNDTLYANSKAFPLQDSVFKVAGGWHYAEKIPTGDNVDLRAANGFLGLCNNFAARLYDESLDLSYNLIESATEAGRFKPVAAMHPAGSKYMYAADNSGGALYEFFVEPGQYIAVFNYQPNAPFDKEVQNMSYGNDQLYVASGAINDVWGPLFSNRGYYVLDEFSWTNYPTEVLVKDGVEYKDIITIQPKLDEEGVIYASSYGSGILELRDSTILRVINKESTNGALAGISDNNQHRVGGFSYDDEGNLWFSNSLTEQPLGVIYADGTVESFSLGSVAASSVDLKDVLYNQNNQVWMQTRNQGVVVSRIQDGRPVESKRLTSSEGSGNLPTGRVLAFAEDQDGEMWIGTDEGIAVLYSPQNIFEPNRNFDAQIIVIDEDGDGNGERVLGSQVIQDIEVDGSNKKWFATLASGVFYTTANGQEQIFNFTTANSPLPSDNILDIEIDDKTGMVYFATDQGIVSFQGTATEGVQSQNDVFAYPNPVEPGYEGPILIRGLVTNAQVKITDIEGNIIYETVAEGGQAVWSGRNFDGRRANSGVYLAYITNDEGSETAVAKILIVN